VQDVLSLPRAPRAVVLSACETAGTATDGSASGMHLARAFLLAGSEFVIASHGEVDDGIAARFSETLYTRSGDVRQTSGPQLLRATALELNATQPLEDLPFHVWVP
jgi:CHAT domain-containing protein